MNFLALKIHYLLLPLKSCNKLFILTVPSWTILLTESLGLGLTDFCFLSLCHWGVLACFKQETETSQDKQGLDISCALFYYQILKILFIILHSKWQEYLYKYLWMCVYRHVYVYIHFMAEKQVLLLISSQKNDTIYFNHSTNLSGVQFSPWVS